jgi:hypothetical protein
MKQVTGREKRIFSSPKFQAGSGPNNPSFGGYRSSFPQVQWPVRDANHSPPSSAEVKNEWNYTLPDMSPWPGTILSPLCLHDVELYSPRYVSMTWNYTFPDVSMTWNYTLPDMSPWRGTILSPICLHDVELYSPRYVSMTWNAKTLPFLHF